MFSLLDENYTVFLIIKHSLLSKKYSKNINVFCLNYLGSNVLTDDLSKYIFAFTVKIYLTRYARSLGQMFSNQTSGKVKQLNVREKQKNIFKENYTETISFSYIIPLRG